MIRIIQVCSDSNIGGAGLSLLNFLRTFDRSNFEVIVVLPNKSLLKPMVEQLGIKVIEVENIADESFNQKSVMLLRNLFKDLKPHLVHTHACISARLAAKSLNVKTIYTRHTVLPPLDVSSGGLVKVLNKFIENFTADGIIAVAQAAKENLIELGIREKKIRVILNGSDPVRRFGAEEIISERERLGVNGNEKVIAMIARLHPIKGHIYFIQAAKKLLDNGIQAKFVIAGTGREQRNIEQQIRDFGLSRDVVLLGFLEDPTGLMNAMDIQVNASYGSEGSSLSLIEGMSLGKPAVVSDFGGNTEVIDDNLNGIVVPEKDSDKLADAMYKLCTNSQIYMDMSQAAAEIYSQKFTSETMTYKIQQFYIDVLTAKGKAKKLKKKDRQEQA